MTVEDVKRASSHLRGELAAELATGAGRFERSGSEVLLKFHGIYQQDDRDIRRERASKKLPLAYSCMVRAAVPGGALSGEQWLALDRLADVADGTMRLTTRQGVQFHFVHKGDLRELVSGINQAALSTLAACGDVVRNIMACPWPDERQTILRPLVAELVERFRPQTRAYWELWVDGDKAVTAVPLLNAAGEAPGVAAVPNRESTPERRGPARLNAAGHVPGVAAVPNRESTPRRRDPARFDESEPVYGNTYLPRKFKIAVAWPGDNCVDALANDIGLVPTLADGTSGDVTGYTLFVGGGLGMSHAREDDTYPRLATPLGWVTPDRVVDAVEAVVTMQRDHGNRDDRHRARLKYLVDERGIGWVRADVEQRLGAPLADPVELLAWIADEHHGTREGVVGVPVPSGRVTDRDGVSLRTALRELTSDGTVTQIHVTARQDLLLHGIAPAAVEGVEQRLRDHGVRLAGDVSHLRRLAIACPALPTCGQALGEAERVLPGLVDELEKAMSDAGASDAPIRLNMTGCPNGCARPYTAEIGIVGRTKKTYDIYVGGSASGDRLAQRIRSDVPLDQIAGVLAPLFAEYSPGVSPDTTFGDWAARVGPATIETWLPAPVLRRRGRTSSDR